MRSDVRPKPDHYASDIPISEENLPQVPASNTAKTKKGKGSRRSRPDRRAARSLVEVYCTPSRLVTEVKLGDVVVEAFLDTGSDVSIVAEEVFKRIDPKFVQKRPLDRKLFDFNKREIPVDTMADVECGGQKAVIRIYIQRKAEKPCLLGAAAIWTLKLLELTPSVSLKSSTGEGSFRVAKSYQNK